MSYTPHPKHRNRTPDISQWTISEQAESDCFALASVKPWGTNAVVWGLHLVANAPAVLGYDVVVGSGNIDVKIAKFVENQGHWHGYPVAHWMGTHDKPDIATLNDWLLNKIINATTHARIYRGKKCKL